MSICKHDKRIAATQFVIFALLADENDCQLVLSAVIFVAVDVNFCARIFEKKILLT